MTPEEKRTHIREYMREKRKQWRADGLCIMCGAGVNPYKPNRKTCDRCSKRSAALQKKKREAKPDG